MTISTKKRDAADQEFSELRFVNADLAQHLVEQPFGDFASCFEGMKGRREGV